MIRSRSNSSCASGTSSPSRGDLLSIGQAAEVVGISTSYLRTLTNEGRVQSYTFGSNHRYYSRSDLKDAFPWTEQSSEVVEEKAVVLYSRRSQRNELGGDDQKDGAASLKRQARSLRDYARKNLAGEKVVEISEHGSGLATLERSGFKRLLRMCLEGKVKTIVVSVADRLTRHPPAMLEAVLDLLNINVVEINPEDQDDDEYRQLFKWLENYLLVLASRRNGSRAQKDADLVTLDGTKRFLTLQAQGYSIEQSAAILTSEGYKTTKGKRITKGKLDPLNKKRRQLARRLNIDVIANQPHLDNFLSTIPAGEIAFKTLYAKYVSWAGKTKRIAYVEKTFSRMLTRNPRLIGKKQRKVQENGKTKQVRHIILAQRPK